MERMTFEEFKNEVVARIKEFLPESFADAEVSLKEVKKNNDLKLTGLVIVSSETNICPTIYLESFYEEYETGADMSEILDRIAEFRMNQDVSEPFDITQITDFEQVKGKLIPRLVNAAMNADLLEERPHKLIADLAVTYCAMLGQFSGRTASVPISNEFMEMWGISVDELHDIAVSNMPNLVPSTFKGLTEAMAESMGVSLEEMQMMGIPIMPTEEEFVYVLSNEVKVCGASALFDVKMMEEITEKIGDFYILPSSVHEVLLVPMEAKLAEELECMVREVNATQVSPEERLSDNIYTYSLEEGLRIVA